MSAETLSSVPSPDAPGLWRPDIDPARDPQRVLLHWGELRDAARRDETGAPRIVPYKLYYPVYEDAQPHPLPVVLWSHGFGGSRNGAGFLARYIAARGYAVLHVQHPGSDSSLWEGRPGHPWDILRRTHISRRASLARFRDIPFVIDSLPAICGALPDVAFDLARLGMSGHSFGAMTTQVIAGQRLGRGRRFYSLADSRVRAAIAYSPSPAYNEAEDPAAVYGPIKIPFLCMTGTQDDSPISGRDYTHRLPIFDYAGSPERQLLVLKEGDHMVYNGSRGKLGGNPLLPVHELIIQVASLAFWDSYLREDAAAKKWLTGGGFASWLGGAAAYNYPGAAGS
jgi:pimeloyl-ACP methyl ester carboxylesterase